MIIFLLSLFSLVIPAVKIAHPDPSYEVMIGEMVSFQCEAVISFVRNYTVNIHDNITFECVATGIPSPFITWYRNETVLNNTADLRVTTSELSDSVITMNSNGDTVFTVIRTLTVTISEDGDSGSYKCRASNEVGEDSIEFGLIVQSKL